MAVEEQLQPGEEVLYRAQVTRISLVPWAAGLVLALAAAVFAWNVQGNLVLSWLGLAVALALAAVILAKWIVLRSHEYVLTDRRVIQQTGILSKRSMDAALDKVNNVEHRQTVWGRLLGYGDVEIDTASETGTTRFLRIRRPLELKRAILTAAETYKTRRAAGPAAAPVLSPAEKIRQLKGLLDDGLISPQEFEAKRRELLAEM